jgi:HD-GYP domain-containing protein (c-di-GMP phosphodiesterase class II)
MRFRTRAFLFSFLPFALLLSGSFWAIQKLVQSTVRDGLRSSLRENHRAIARLRSRTDLQNSRFLRVAGENAALKAGIQLVLSNAGSEAARLTLEDQLRELCARMGFDFLVVSDPSGTPLAGVFAHLDQRGHPDGQWTELNGSPARFPVAGLTTREGKVYQVASIPVDLGADNIAQLLVGERFDLSEFSTPEVLMRNGNVVMSSVPGAAPADLERALAGCAAGRECEIRLGGASFLSLPLEDSGLGDFSLRSLQNIDSASRPVQVSLGRIFIVAATGALCAALLFSLFSSLSIVRPLALLIEHLRHTALTGELPEFAEESSGLREVRELTGGFNRAAAAIRDARDKLRDAYVEFVGSLASALDARDRYTSGHSCRVSDLACATAEALGISAAEREEIRIGALLHDIGKIGIADAVLQKPGRLTNEEFAVVQQHPVIGRRILEGVHGFTPYLSSVELHHENWDGSGYPHGQRGTETPLCARIIHVVDAYDAMTTDRLYRPGMTHARAIQILHEFAGRQFDPAVVEAFTGLAMFEAERQYEASVVEVA